MNSRQLQYAIILSQVLNISQAAEMLKITQPALSKQILSLERELGVALFDRSTTPLTLTPAGESFVRDAKELLFKEEKLKRSMEDFKTGEKGCLKIGISPFRATYFISDIIKKLQNKYPALKIILNETNSTQLHKDAVDGQIDFAIINLPVDEAVLDVIPLKPEPLILAIHKSLCNNRTNLESKKSGKLSSINLSGCKDIPFIALSKNQELRQLFDKLCIACDFVPDIKTEVVSITTAWSLAQAGIGATILPLKFIESNPFNNELMIFTLENTATVRQPAIVMRKGQYMSKYALKAVDLIKNR